MLYAAIKRMTLTVLPLQFSLTLPFSNCYQFWISKRHINMEKSLEIFTDASFDHHLNIATYGIWHRNDCVPDNSGIVPKCHSQSINTGELYAILQALRDPKRSDLSNCNITVYTDSQYALLALEDVSFQHSRELTCQINLYIQALESNKSRVKVLKVKSGQYGNSFADLLAYKELRLARLSITKLSPSTIAT